MMSFLVKSKTATVVLPCLGVPFQLGMLYDCRSNQVIPGVTLWDEKLLREALSEHPQPSSAFDIIAEDTISSKSDSLGVEGNLSLSLMSGLVSVEGAAKYFDDKKSSSRQARVTLQYTCTSKFQQLTMEQLATSNIQHPDSVFKENSQATHVVSAVLYGADAFFIFDREVTTNENHRSVHGKMQAHIKAIPSLQLGISGGVGINYNTKDKEETDKFHCKFYGDIILDSNPSTYEDAVKVYNELPKYLGENWQNTVPKKVWLHPLSDLNSKAARMVRELSTSLITQTQQTIEALNEMEIRSNDLVNSETFDSFQHLKEQMLNFLEIIKEHKTNFTKDLSKLLPQIRGGGIKEQELASLITGISKSPLNNKSLDNWLRGKGEELKHLAPYYDNLKIKGVTMAFEPDDFGSAINDMNCDNVLSFEFKLSSQCDDDTLQQMLSYLRTGNTNQSCTSSKHWYKTSEVNKNLRIKAKLFIAFAKANFERPDVKFLVTSNRDEDDDKANVGAVIMHYAFGAGTNFEPPSQPSKLVAPDIQDTSVSLKWSTPQFGLENIKNYTVLYRLLADKSPNAWMTQSTKSQETDIIINQLNAGKKYVLKVQAETEIGHSEESELLTIETKPPLVNIHLQNILSNSKIISKEKLPVTYKISLRKVPLSKKHKNIVKMELGDPPHPSKPTKVLMVVGATGAGKSTLINAMANYILGIKWENEFRLKLITDEVSENQAHSQTQDITAYTFYWHEGSPLNCNLTIIDTPGFGDTRGLQRDQEITASIREFFQMKGRDGIDELHAIGFVTQAALARLTPTQKYISDSILSIFGKDIKDNIFIMTTFADGADPPVMGAVREANIPHIDFFPFNNSALFVDSSKSKFAQMFWDMGYASLETFFVKFDQVKSVSLQLTRQVLEERRQLETIVLGIQPQINAGFAKIDELHQEEQVLKANESDILSNKDFTYEVTVTKQRQVNAPKGTYVTNCAECHFTCHDSCAYADDRDKWKCCVMNGGKSNATCTVCPGKCSWRRHFNNGYHFELYEEVETRTSKELFDRYNEAKTAKQNIEGIIKKMEDELKQLHSGVLHKIQEARGCLQRLDEIALKPNPLTELEYIDLLIESEKQGKQTGWKNRVDYFYQVREQAEIFAKLKDPKKFEIGEQNSKGLWEQFTSKFSSGVQQARHWAMGNKQ